MLKKVLFLFLCFLPLYISGCNENATLPEDSLQNQSQSSVGMLQGKVTIGPNCPVEYEDQPCDADLVVYLSHQLVILSEDKGTVVKEVSLDGAGNYATELLPGTYFVDIRPHDIGISEFDPLKAVIEAGQTTILNFEIDTGLR